jgi:hypothetical protein
MDFCHQVLFHYHGGNLMLSRNVLYYGKDEPLPEQIPLRAGPLSLIYEDGDVRYVKLGDKEILRRIYVAIRDRNWGTVLPKISNLEVDAGQDSFRITYDVENKEGDIDFVWKGTITGDPDGKVSFAMDGEARSTFLRARIGFCILHPMEYAGATCRLEHVDGTTEEHDFPQYIAPQFIIDGEVKPVHPFNELRAMAYEVVPGVWAETQFEGDIFEMEDQRNWTDASYKTYCTPLRLPFPVEVKQGTKISQSVTLTLSGDLSDATMGLTEQELTFSIAEQPISSLPRIGLGAASHGQPLTANELSRLKALNLSHLRVDLRLPDPDYETILRQVAAEARTLGVSLEVALFLSNSAENELQSLIGALDQISRQGTKPQIATWIIFHQQEKSTSEKWTRLARQYLSGYDPQAKIGSGTDFFFTELNRGRPAVEALDLVTYSLNPQVHAFDNASLAETLEAQASTVESARQFSGGLPLSISSITFKMRANPNATGPEPEPVPGELPRRVDVRQMSLFGAGWLAGSLKYVGQSNVHSVTYFETTGWLGVMETEAGPPLPEKFHSLPGGVFPMYHVLADVGEFAGGEVLPTRPSNSLKVDGLAVRKDGRTRVLLANLSPEPQHVTVTNLSQHVRVRHLDETNAEDAMRAPEEFRAQAGELRETTSGALELSLPPYAVARIDSV